MASTANNTKNTYLCHECKHVFQAEDSLNLSCPKCGSDNIDEKNKKNSLLLPKIIVFLLAVAIGYFVTPLLIPQPLPNEPKLVQPLPVEPALTLESEDSTSTDTVAAVGPVEVQTKPIKVVCTTPVNVDNRYVYSFTATSDYDGKNKIEYHLLTTPEKIDPIKISSDGNFKDVPPAENPEAFYWVCAVVKDENRTSDTVRVEGLKARPVEVLRKVTAAEVVAILNKREAARKNSMYFSKAIQIHAEGRTFNDLSDFERHIGMKNLTVESVQLKHNSQNKVTSITVTYVNN
ncbi:MAG: zinc ribbon domain-containing protein [Alistipes sp.]|nr:zinc ribbon domain-containing protein [Alistipes sp.]